MALADGTSLLNEFDCPLFSLAQTILSVIAATYLHAAVSFCNEACTFVERNHTRKRKNRNVKACF